MFGWSYPPGAANDPNAPWNQEEGPCAVCCRIDYDCICPECPTCHHIGDLTCYVEGPNKHFMKMTIEQAASRQKARIEALKERLNEEEGMLSNIVNGYLGKEIDIERIPDPWR
jgi:hypothetical protein